MSLPDTFQFRQIVSEDINYGILDLIQEFREFKIEPNFIKQWKSYLESLNKQHQHWIIFDKKSHQIIATGTIWIEQKLIHNFGKVGHIEDIIVSKKYRKHGLGKYLVNKLVGLVKKSGAYKVQLYSDQNTIPFYEKIGFSKCDSGLSIYFFGKI